MNESIFKPSFSLLHIEDSEIDHELLKRAVDKSDHSVLIHWSADSDQAFEYLTACRDSLPSIILLDLNLPGEDGKMFLTRLRSTPVAKIIPVIVLSSSSAPSDVDCCFLLGANAFVQKSLKPKEFEIKIQSLLDFWFSTAVIPLSGRSQ